jgi:hypothetical protein
MKYVHHTFLYGMPGSWKTRMMATYPRPMKVLSFEGPGKDVVFREAGKVEEVTLGPIGAPVPGIRVTNSKGKVIYEVVYFNDPFFRGPDHQYAIEKFREYLPTVAAEVQDGQWATIGLDGITSMEIAARKFEQYKNNPTSNDGNKQDARQWYAESANAIEDLVNGFISWLPIHVVVIGHIKVQEDEVRGELVYLPNAPGKKAIGLPAAFGECYYLDVHTVEGKEVALAQTSRDGKFVACNQLGLPKLVPAHYKAIMKIVNERGKNEGS